VTDRNAPSYADLVYEVLRSARRPLTFREIFDAVSRLRVITTKNPQGTIRGALTAGRQLVSLGDGRYGYLPSLVEQSLLRVPLPENKPAHHPLIYSDEVRQALWPSFFETRKRKNERPLRVRLPSDQEISLALEFFGRGIWGSHMPEDLRRYLVDQRADAGDALLVRVHDGEAGRAEARLEPRLKRDDARVAERNRELADAAERVLQAKYTFDTPIWDLAITLLARGLYRADVPPDPLAEVLRADPRFVDAGLHGWALAEAVTPDMLADFRERKRLETELLQAFEPDQPDEAEPSTHGSMRATMERTLSDLRALFEERQFNSIEEANTALQEMLSTGSLPRRASETPLQRAQELIYDAWDAPSPRERVRLAREALRISPDCADAYVLLAEEARDAHEAVDLLRHAVAAGERALGKEAFVREVGHFWGLIETRPYMRARFDLAQALWAEGRRQEAIANAWDLLRLNPNDNQGVRDVLLAWLFELGDDAHVEKLLRQFPEDAMALFAYGRALHAYRTQGNSKQARKLLATALNENPHVPTYLLGKKRLPRHLPDTIGFGDESEAIVCAAELLPGWRNTPGAQDWLAQQAK
jgi:tetratricopeptide (TPR) repeat protein